jgi:F-BAR domain only protein
LSFIIEYSLNPAFATGPVTVNNLILMATYEGAKAAGCQTKPAGTLLKEKNIIYWRVGDVTLDASGTAHKVIGRLIGAEGGEPKPGVVEARWEVASSDANNIAIGRVLGSGLGISRLDAGKEKEKDNLDPFADELTSGGTATANPPGSSSGLGGGDGVWVEVESVRRVVSGRYDARQAAVDAVASPAA